MNINKVIIDIDDDKTDYRQLQKEAFLILLSSKNKSAMRYALEESPELCAELIIENDLKFDKEPIPDNSNTRNFDMKENCFHYQGMTPIITRKFIDNKYRQLRNKIYLNVDESQEMNDWMQQFISELGL